MPLVRFCTPPNAPARLTTPRRRSPTPVGWIRCIKQALSFSHTFVFAPDRVSHEASLVVDVVLGDRGGTDHVGLLEAWAAAAEMPRTAALRIIPPLEDVDAARLEQVGRQHEVQASPGARARLWPTTLDACRQVVVAVFKRRPTERVRRLSALAGPPSFDGTIT